MPDQSVLEQAIGAAEPTPPTSPVAATEIPDRAAERHAEIEELPTDTIVLIANGKSRVAYEIDLAAYLGGLDEDRKAGRPPTVHAPGDQVWCVGNAAGRYQCDRAFEMRGNVTPSAYKHRPVDAMGRPAPIFVPRITPEMHEENLSPNGRIWLEFPAQDVLSRYSFLYFNSTAAWAMMAAAYRGAKTIKVFGFDFDEAHIRACCEFWFGIMAMSGLNMVLPNLSTLTDAHRGRKPIGYDRFDMPHKGPRFTP